MINDIEMRWVMRWWWGFIPYWKLQYRTERLIQPGPNPNVMTRAWGGWQDVNEGKEL